MSAEPQISVQEESRSEIRALASISTRRMTYEEFLNCPDLTPFAEWVNGEVIELAPPELHHQDILGFLHVLLSLFVKKRSLGKVYMPPTQMKTKPELPGRQPDLVFVSRENAHRLKRNFIDGPADLAVEIVSPDRPTRDYVEKFREYQRGGVREYWLIDPGKKDAAFYALNSEGNYDLIPISDGQIMHSVVLDGFWMNVGWLWQDPLPQWDDITDQWKSA